jgi:hypothetical protein
MFTISENMRTPDTWFLLLVSAIEAHLRLVGDINDFELLNINTPIYIICGRRV